MTKTASATVPAPLVALTLVGLALAGCNANATAPAATPAVSTATQTGPMRPPGGPNAAAEDICVKAVQQQTNAADVAVIGSESGQGGIVVMVGYPATSAPWRCLVGAQGNVTEVTFTGGSARS